ncbi:MAG: multicopper oxidase domain-containing protein [Alicyclobacillaceae bacterium]|nr:multicopper oxidase domain-containing protein [Alicyclobacillaceae bacterium]
MLTAKVGDKVLVHLINIGDMNHPMHLHGFHFQVLAQDGSPLPAPQTMDTIDTAPGTTYDLSFTADQAGKWLFHCHILPHVTSGTDMSGMITLFDVTKP